MVIIFFLKCLSGWVVTCIKDGGVENAMFL